MKVTWYSNAPWCATGYGQQTALVAPRIARAGHDVTLVANFGLAGTPHLWEGLTVIGGGYDAYANDVAPAHHVRWLGDEPGWMITLFDAWVLKFPALERVASWVPVDHLTVPPEVLAWTRSHFTIAMSRFGQEVLKDAGVDARYVPHAIDTNVYVPGAQLVARPDTSWREGVGIAPDAFVVGIVGANKGFPSRKGYPEMFMAMTIFMARHPDVELYVHADAAGFQGVDLVVLQNALGMDSSRIRYVDQFANRVSLISNEDMAAVYNGFDVLLNCSLGEGFGIPVIEAQACGVPVIVTDATAQPELVGAGWKVAGQPWWDAPQQSMWVTPNVHAIIDALEEAYAARGDAALRERARLFALGYDVERVFEAYWRPVLAEMETLLVDAPAEPPINLALRRSGKRKGRK